MPIVHLFCGLPGAGKTTHAKSIEAEGAALRFTLDEWMKSICDYSIYDAEYSELASRLKLKFWDLSKAILAANLDVILDWSLWNREMRREWTERVQKAGYDYRLYYINSPVESIEARLSARNAQSLSDSHEIPLEEFRRFQNIFEAPTSQEGINISVINILDDTETPIL